MKKKITGTDVAYYVSIVAMIACALGIFMEIKDGTFDLGMWLLFFLMEALCFRSTSRQRKQRKAENEEA